MGSGSGTSRTSPWNRYVEAAVKGEAAAPRTVVEQETAAGLLPDAAGVPQVRSASAAGRRRTLTLPAASLRRLRSQWTRPLETVWKAAVAELAGNSAVAGKDTPRRRTDVRLALPAAAVWGASIAGLWLQPAPLAGLCCALIAFAVLLLCRARRQPSPGCRRRPSAGMTGQSSARRSFLATGAAAFFLAAAAAAHSAVASTHRFEGPLSEAVAAGKSVVAVVEVGGIPRALTAPNQAGPPARWSVPVRTRDISTGGVQLRTRAQMVVMGSGGWASLVPGQLVRVTGKLRPPDPGREEAAVLTASSGPGSVAAGHPGSTAMLQGAVRELRERFVAAASFLAPDPRGLLPGMVTGDTSALDEGLKAAMKNVGMTHLTAVSGANCSLVLGALLLGCRSLRLPRVPAAVLAGAGLCLFVVLVGPDASVLRAALMGVVSVIALASGRSGRGLSFLCLAVIGLLLADPGLGSSFGFLLSVLATLGIIILGRQIIDWVPLVIPRWVAAAVAVPLSAQLLCGRSPCCCSPSSPRTPCWQTSLLHRWLHP
nr:ComEC/Rec2 family competence protein [Pseudarthrobacter sp. NamB4]